MALLRVDRWKGEDSRICLGGSSFLLVLLLTGYVRTDFSDCLSDLCSCLFLTEDWFSVLSPKDIPKSFNFLSTLLSEVFM